MSIEDLKKSVCINLRCVTQSSKGGVPLNQLHNEYSQLLGMPIPLKDLGYSSLENFLRAIPDVICLKKNGDGSLIAEAVADASTAHIAKLISKQKSTKNPKPGVSKPAVLTRKWGNSVKTNFQQHSKSSLKNCNSSPPSALVENHELNSKFQFIPLTPQQQELKKSVLINLRSVVQSCKDGVPLNRLQNDYRKFIGSNIPFKNLGCNTLDEFIQGIPDVVHLEKDIKGLLIAKGVVDASTAHLFANKQILQPSKSISPPPEHPSNGAAAHHITSEQKAESSFFKLPPDVLELSDLKGILECSPTQKKLGKKKQAPPTASKVLLENNKKTESKEELTRAEPLKTANPINKKENSSPVVSTTKADIISSQNQKKFAKSTYPNLPSTSAFQTANNVSGVEKNKKCSAIFTNENLTDSRKGSEFLGNLTPISNGLTQPVNHLNYLMSDKSIKQGGSSKSSCSSVSTDHTKPDFDENLVDLLSEIAASKARLQQLETSEASEDLHVKTAEVGIKVKNASLSPIVWMHFLLFGPSNMEILKKEILSFSGFPFSMNSKEWREKIKLISQLPKKALQHCLHLLNIQYNPRDSKKKLLVLLINSLAAYTEGSGSYSQETEQEASENELYASTLTLSSFSSVVSSNADTEYSDIVPSNKNPVVPKTKHKLILRPDSDLIASSSEKHHLLNTSSYCIENAKQAVQIGQMPILLKNSIKQKQSTCTKSVLPKLSVSEVECSQTETSNLVIPKSAKQTRQKKKSGITEKNIGLPATKPINSHITNNKECKGEEIITVFWN